MESTKDSSVELPVKFFYEDNVKNEEPSTESKNIAEPSYLSKNHDIRYICCEATGKINISLVDEIYYRGEWILNSVVLVPIDRDRFPIKVNAHVTSGSSPHVTIYVPRDTSNLVIGPVNIVIILINPFGDEEKLVYEKIYISWASPCNFLLYVIEKEFGSKPDFKTVSEFLFGVSKRWREFLSDIYPSAYFRGECRRHLHDYKESKCLQNLRKSKSLTDFVRWFCDTCTFYSLYDPDRNSKDFIGRLLNEGVIHPYMYWDEFCYFQETSELDLLEKAQRKDRNICLIRIASHNKSLAVCCLDKEGGYIKLLIENCESYFSTDYLWGQIHYCARQYGYDFSSFDVLTTEGKVRSATEVFGRQ